MFGGYDFVQVLLILNVQLVLRHARRNIYPYPKRWPWSFRFVSMYTPSGIDVLRHVPV